jgi:hypothetical protein
LIQAVLKNGYGYLINIRGEEISVSALFFKS